MSAEEKVIGILPAYRQLGTDMAAQVASVFVTIRAPSNVGAAVLSFVIEA